jgi:putative NIF3 family GTP cyclohydrolase 1 type 2
MPTIADVIAHITRLSGHPLYRDEGIHFSPVEAAAAERPLTGVTVCWMATPAAIEAAGRRGHQLLLGHESLYYPYDAAVGAPAPEGWQDWPVNRQRRDLLARHDLSFLRGHGSIDEICILDDFAALLGLDQPVKVVDPWVKVWAVSPCTLGKLAQRVKQRMNLPRVRVSPAGEPDRLVSRVGLPWGGMGLFTNVGYQQQLIEQGCDVFIAGETDNYGFRFAAECGIPMIETSHELSENPGLSHYSAMLSAAFPQLDVAFYETPCVWQPA